MTDSAPAIGIISLNASYPVPPGNMANPDSFTYPVLYRTVDIRPGWWLNEERMTQHREAFLACASELQDLGVRAITTTCGLFAVFQRDAAKALNVPVFTTPLSLIPLVSGMIGANSSVGVVTAAGHRLLERDFLRESGVDPRIPLAIAAVDACQEFLDTIRFQRKKTLDITAFREQLTAEVLRMLEEKPDTGALVLECSDIPMFANHLAKTTGLPVFDFVALTDLVHQALVPKSFTHHVPLAQAPNPRNPHAIPRR